LKAANGLISQLQADDRVQVISFDGCINVLTGALPVAELERQRVRLDAINDGTVLYDAVSVTTRLLNRMPGRKAIVLLSDGIDEGSRATAQGTIRDAVNDGVLICTVQYSSGETAARLAAQGREASRHERRLAEEWATGSSYLRALARNTGGRYFDANEVNDLAASFAVITDDLGRQYSLGYYSTGRLRPGEPRAISVRVRPPDLMVHARDSYVSTQR